MNNLSPIVNKFVGSMSSIFPNTEFFKVLSVSYCAQTPHSIQVSEPHESNSFTQVLSEAGSPAHTKSSFKHSGNPYLSPHFGGNVNAINC